MNNPQWSPLRGIVTTDASSTIVNMSMDNLPEEIDAHEQVIQWLWCQLSYQLKKLSTPQSKSSPAKKGESGILKIIASNVFSTPTLESRTRKGMQSNERMMMFSGTSMKRSSLSGQQEEKNSFSGEHVHQYNIPKAKYCYSPLVNHAETSHQI